VRTTTPGSLTHLSSSLFTARTEDWQPIESIGSGSIGCIDHPFVDGSYDRRPRAPATRATG
jgi:hypothetical protein